MKYDTVVIIYILLSLLCNSCFAEVVMDPFDENRLHAYKNSEMEYDDEKKICKDRWFNIVEPDWMREREYLETFKFKDLIYSGVVSRNGSDWALIKVPDGGVVRVSTGNYLGKDIGRVRTIKKLYIVATEIKARTVSKKGKIKTEYYRKCSYIMREGYEDLDLDLPEFP